MPNAKRDKPRVRYMSPRADEFRVLSLIPPKWLHSVSPPFAKISDKQKDAIRQLLGFKKDEVLPRCKGKRWKFVREREAAGDKSHSESKHLCHECQCEHVAGTGTKGDFYGLGPETGCFGVGYCRECWLHLSLRPAWQLWFARKQVRELQAYGRAVNNMDSDYALKVMREEAELAERTTKARQEFEMVLVELERFDKMLSGELADAPTEMTPRGPEPMADKTRIALKLDIAKTLSRLRLNDLKLDANSYLHVDELKRRIPEVMTLAFQCLSKLEELIVAKQVKGEPIETDMTPQEYVRLMFQSGMKTIWSEAKTGRKRE